MGVYSEPCSCIAVGWPGVVENEMQRNTEQMRDGRNARSN